MARVAQPTEDRDKVIVAAVAGAHGAQQAIRVASELRSGGIRAQLLEYAAGMMLCLQRYAIARELLAEGDAAGLTPVMSGMLERLVARPAIQSGTADPRSAVRDVLAAAFDRFRKTPAFWDAALDRSARARLRRLVVLPPWGRSTRLVEDWLGAAAIQIEGEGGVWRATVEGMGERGRLYLALDRGIVKLVGAPELPSGIGRYVLATAGDPNGEARARRLLDWLRADLDAAADEDAFRKVWSGGPTAPREAIRAAAAVLARTTDADRAMAVAARCPSTRPDLQLACLETLAAAEAERGDLDAAVHDHWKVMELAGTVEPHASDWYVAGRIYEQLGLTGDAAAAYKRIAPSTDAGETPYSRAQRRLAAMQAQRAAP